ncbi:bacteriocin immunity protein [Pseudomonas sp. V88_4]|uniref:bacteriocin immunity protein n=1 Tax=Pseudomonas sp. V88_4 TaxID=3044229 RepID=UPI00249DACB5|nr:bacteriocin immunity protein [Pseudomonas sp. V88_4]MDI3397260.1 bacteriocin immunity protein [Pseudomonas sp. V88_4]
MKDPFIKNNISEYTEREFVSFLEEIFKEDQAPSDTRADLLVRHFNKIVGHPEKMNLIYRPLPEADDSAEGITRTIKEWRISQGLPGFKSD